MNKGTHLIKNEQVTRFGKVLRRLKVDELPQAINVLKGEMSFVGPRPCLPNQKQLVALRDHYGIFQVRPGITGLGQVSGVTMSSPEHLTSIDYQYVQLRSLVLDLKLIIATVFGMKMSGLEYRNKKFKRLAG